MGYINKKESQANLKLLIKVAMTLRTSNVCDDGTFMFPKESEPSIERPALKQKKRVSSELETLNKSGDVIANEQCLRRRNIYVPKGVHRPITEST